ncbi:XK-related protein 8-like [Narcine bancroftii]|uniref:XK-related protein 8-like n=1 Tax=Narcine bancroftii TaxID=1343680 RepID=UPI003831ECB0
MFSDGEIRFSGHDLFFLWVGLATSLLDLGTDAWVAHSLCLAGDDLWGTAVVGLVALCSAVVQLFSWVWFAGDRKQLGSLTQSGLLPKLKSAPGVRVLGLLHWLQMGLLVRYINALELGFQMYKEKDTMGLQYAIYLSCDISMLRLFESILENTPQLTLMLYIIMKKNQIEIYQYFSFAASFLSIAWAVLDFHQSLRASLSDKMSLQFKSIVPYFLCNLLLIFPRIVSIALFATVFKQYVFFHFAIIWLSMFFWVWQQGTSFMNNFPEEVFYRGMVGVILYFTWLNISEGRTLIRQIIYHSFMAVDCGILVGFWWLHRDPILSAPYTVQLLVGTSSSYLVGVIVKCVYYKYFHPFVTEHMPSLDETDSLQEDGFQSMCKRPLINKRMEILSNSFYSLPPEEKGFITKVEETKI